MRGENCSDWADRVDKGFKIESLFAKLVMLMVYSVF